MALVVDASVTACWAFDDEGHPVAARALDQLRLDQAHAPEVWRLEVHNVLVVNERRGRIHEAGTARFLRTLSRLPIVIDHALIEHDLLAIARTHRLNAYGAAYLELAVRLDAPLATLDAALAKAAAAAGVVLL
jgi:predicted nucleic acid-binding protein